MSFHGHFEESVTLYESVDYLLPTQWGSIPYRAWCEKEADRMNKNSQKQIGLASVDYKLALDKRGKEVRTCAVVRIN